MAHHKSAKKRIRTNGARRIRGQSYISSVRTAVKSFTMAVEKGADTQTIQSTFSAAQRLLAKASSKGLIHKNTASRKTGRLALLLKKFQAGELTTEKPKRAKAKVKNTKALKAAKAAKTPRE